MSTDAKYTREAIDRLTHEEGGAAQEDKKDANAGGIDKAAKKQKTTEMMGQRRP